MSDYFDRIERQLVTRVEAAGAARRPSLRIRAGWLVPAAAVLVAVAVLVVFAGTGSAPRSDPAPAAGNSGEIVLTATAVAPHTSLIRALTAAVTIMRRRLPALGVGPGVTITRSGAEIVVRGSRLSPAGIALLAEPGRLRFYDWEANVLTPAGTTVATALTGRHPSAAALRISQGAGDGPGGQGGGGMALYDAVRLAAGQPVELSTTASLSRVGPEYYLFGAPRSAACRAAGAADAFTPIATRHCYLAGPAASVAALRAERPAGVAASAGQVLTVPQGTTVLQAASSSASGVLPASDPAAHFFVLHDDVALSGSELTDPHAGIDSGGSPDVEFGFDARGAAAFREVTAVIAHRGSEVSTVGQTLDQHVAIALDGRLLTLVSISFQQYPDGVAAGSGAELSGAFTRRTASEIAAILRYGALPVTLVAR